VRRGELNAAQGKPVDIGGYFMPSRELLDKAMCPSPTFNSIIQAAKA
jgi:isocitrate dehydrogenase